MLTRIARTSNTTPLMMPIATPAILPGDIVQVEGCNMTRETSLGINWEVVVASLTAGAVMARAKDIVVTEGRQTM